MLRIVLKSFQAGSDKGEDFGGIGFDLFFRCPDAARRITGQIIPGISELAEAFAIEDQLSRRTGADMRRCARF